MMQYIDAQDFWRQTHEWYNHTHPGQELLTDGTGGTLVDATLLVDLTQSYTTFQLGLVSNDYQNTRVSVFGSHCR